MKKDDCIFCRIVAGDIPATKVYEDDDTLAFMDIGPIVKGHILVIPKQHYDPIDDTPDDVLARIIKVVKRISMAQKKALGAEGCNVIQNNGACAGQLVEHLHFHVIPRYADDGHKWNWDAKSYNDSDEMGALAKNIAEAL